MSEGRKQIVFTVPAVPVAQPRPRAAIGHHGRAMVYGAKKEHKVHSFKATVRLVAQQNYHGAPLTGPLYLGITFVFPRPKSMIWKKRPMPRVPHVTRPDADNCVKTILDALNELVFVDDAQVAACYCEKLIASGDEQPHVVVTIYEFQSEGMTDATGHNQSKPGEKQMELLA